VNVMLSLEIMETELLSKTRRGIATYTVHDQSLPVFVHLYASPPKLFNCSIQNNILEIYAEICWNGLI
jgi:hypothetical protein